MRCSLSILHSQLSIKILKSMFENLEVWWVTGAQLLYGGDAVVAVDGHSKEMVEGLNNSVPHPV